MMSVRMWGPGVGAVAVLLATGVWARWPAGVDTRLWSEVRPVVEARLVAQAGGSGYGESVPALGAKWFCRAEALDLRENGDRVRAGVDTLCLEYGVRDGALVECGGAHFPQVVRLERATDGGYRVVAQEEPPDGAATPSGRRTTSASLPNPGSTTTQGRPPRWRPRPARTSDCPPAHRSRTAEPQPLPLGRPHRQTRFASARGRWVSRPPTGAYDGTGNVS